MEKNKKKSKSDPLWAKVIIFYQNNEFYKKFTQIGNELFASSIYSIRNSGDQLDFFLLQIYSSLYPLIYIEIDHVFHKLDEIYQCIKSSKNKNSKTYPVTTNSKNFNYLKENVLTKKSMPLLWNGEQILDVKKDKYPYLRLRKK